ncbi:phosphate ABC transporter permease PstA [Gallaecimonas pentaromativorans]|uniref:Phosphate transport system permease protein PstA n=1 Tax=Gallaecimonas pentaromativorans TaxID=584787 RepID=A0A3N1PUH8_9GAMM|nr:phosphate ABC transporter permease PstA [Gallaecimonas pentaromativorans]MED5523206.1 phosphate ABC transporter permease PstA [Pseudomonadota bacterium]ROQ30400.1 phosphate ABC transporter membrane protein 2 (PhoT family) [Gallaecimonas pentaromativorans]
MIMRKAKNVLFKAFCLGATLLGLGVLVLILYTLFEKGLAGMSWSLFTEVTPGPGGEGGLANAIIGSVMMTALGIVLATPIGVLAGTWLAEFGQNSKTADTIRFLNGMLMSAPSILVGLFVYQLVVVGMGHFSGWAGSIALAIIALPIIISTTEEMLKLVPRNLREAGAGLGTPRWKVIVSLCYRSVGTGIVTGILLSVARISGETAPLLFTALNSSFMTLNPNEPMANLPVTIYQFAMSPYESWNQLAWAGALLITMAILLLNILSRVLPQLKKRRS